MNFGYRNSFQLIDKGNIEVFGPLGFAYYLKTYSKIVASQQSGFLSHYSFLMVVSLLCFLTTYLYTSLGSFHFIDSFFVSLVFSYVFFSLNDSNKTV